nr:prepilin peptidase [uncultured Vibrio sp.]
MSGLIIGTLALASVWDIKTQRVPNLISLAVFVIAVFTLFVQPEPMAVKTILASVLVTMAITLPGYIKGWLGGADIKLLLALALISNFEQMLWLLITAFIFFIIYWWVLCRDKGHAPFVPALFVAVCLQTFIV